MGPSVQYLLKKWTLYHSLESGGLFAPSCSSYNFMIQVWWARANCSKPWSRNLAALGLDHATLGLKCGPKGLESLGIGLIGNIEHFGVELWKSWSFRARFDVEDITNRWRKVGVENLTRTQHISPILILYYIWIWIKQKTIGQISLQIFYK